MDIEEIAVHFDRVKWTARGFTALCPAHDDRTPSLAVDEGRSWYVVSCGVGCRFDDIVAAAGLRIRDFKIGDDSDYDSKWASDVNARNRMRKMREANGRVLTTLAEIVEVALSPDPEWFADVTSRWSLMDLPFVEAIRMWHPVMDGPVFDVLHGGHDRFVKDWTVEKGEVSRRLMAAYRIHGPR